MGNVDTVAGRRRRIAASKFVHSRVFYLPFSEKSRNLLVLPTSRGRRQHLYAQTARFARSKRNKQANHVIDYLAVNPVWRMYMVGVCARIEPRLPPNSDSVILLSLSLSVMLDDYRSRCHRVCCRVDSRSKPFRAAILKRLRIKRRKSRKNVSPSSQRASLLHELNVCMHAT